MEIINKYINDVISNRIVVGKYARLRVERYLADVQKKRFHFDTKAAKKAVLFFGYLRQYKGSTFSGKKFELSPWQAFDVWNIFGWKTYANTRRFHYAYIDVARKNGKTTFAAAIALYLLMMDQEPGAEIYTVATKKDQARICLDDARNIVKVSPDLKKYAQVWTHAVTCETMGSSMKALSSDSNTLDGLNPHGVILDEFHAHKDDLVFNVMKSAMGSRRNPLMLLLTTAGFNRNVPCYRYRDVAMKVLDGTLTQDDLYVSIHTIDKDDDYHDETVWTKSNPNLNVSVNIDFLRSEYTDAKNNPDRLYNFLTKNLNIWTDSAEAWIDHDTWMGCNMGVENLDGAECYAGLDLASVRDTNALALRFQKPDGQSTYKMFFWMPEMNVLTRVKDKGINYDVWIRDGFIRETPGNITDYDFIKADMLKICEQFNVKKIGYDRWNSSQLVIDLTNQGLKMIPIGQGYATMSAPTKEIEKEILSKNMNHEGNPVLAWHISNVSIQRDPAGNVKIDKARSSEKVDGAVAMVMAKALYMIDHGAEDKISANQIYANKTIRTL